MKLRQVRQQKALALQKEVEIHLHDLMLPHARFILQLKDAKPSAHGLDAVSYTHLNALPPRIQPGCISTDHEADPA